MPEFDEIKQKLENKDQDIRIKALKELFRFGGKDEVDTFVEVMLYDSNPKVREEAAFLLGNIGGEKALLEVLNDKNSHPDVREICIVALGRIGSDNAINALEKALYDLKDNPNLRQAIPREIALSKHPRAKMILEKGREMEKDPRVKPFFDWGLNLLKD